MFLIGIAIPVIFMWKGARDVREEQSGLASFGEMFKIAFFIFVIGSLINSIAYFALRKFDPVILEKEADAAIEMASGLVDRIANLTGGDDEQMEKMKEEMAIQNEITREQMMNMGVGSIILNWLGSLIGGVILSLIIGGIMKRGSGT